MTTIHTPSDHILVKTSIASQQITDTVNGTGVDCQGWEVLLAVIDAGDMGTGTTTVKLQQSSDDGVADSYADVASATQDLVAAGENEPYLIEVNLSERERYIRAVATEDNADGYVGVLFHLMLGRHLPPTQDNDVTQIGFA